MRRRRLLQTAGASVVGLPGCASRITGPDSRTPTSTPSLSTYACPPSGPEKDTVVCSHTVDTATVSVYLLPSNPVVETTETVELTLYNDSSTDLKFNPYQWSIQRQTADGWESVEKRTSGNGRLVLSPGNTQTWTFREVVDFINDQAPTDAGVYTAAIDVPDPGGSDWIQCLALFRIV